MVLSAIRANEFERLSDTQILQRFVAQNDQRAFAELVFRHGSLVFNLCLRILRHEQDAEDAFQATFLILARKARSIQRQEALGSWLYKVAYRIALRAQAGNKNRERGQQSLLQRLLTSCTPNREPPVDYFLEEEIARLPEKYRAPILLCYLQGRTNEEAAELLHCPTGTVKIRLLRARALLRRRLVRRGVGLSLLALLTQAGRAQADVTSSLVDRTAQAAIQQSAGHVLATSGLSESVTSLADGWSRRMALAKLKLSAALLLIVSLLTATDRLLHRAQGALTMPAPQQLVPVQPLVPEYTPQTPERGYGKRTMILVQRHL